LAIVEPVTAGNPQDESEKWAYLTQVEIVDALRGRGFGVGRKSVSQLLKKHGYKRRKMLKANSLSEAEGRDEQFKRIDEVKQAFLAKGLPVLSIDTKKKEMLGNFHRNGSRYAKAPRKVNDHDFKSHATGQVVPHGIYDLAQNRGYISLGQSHDTSEFVCDNIAHFWGEDLQWRYPDAPAMLLLCDGGGSNSSRHYIVKQDLSRLAKALEMDILVAHYPPYCSKWNPIEHRLFSQVSRSWDGVVFENIQIVKERAERTSTKKGLEVRVWTNRKEYQTQRTVEESFKSNLSDFISFAEVNPSWNYLVKA
jgi:hypothetical protein